MVTFLARCVLFNRDDAGEIGISGDGPSGSATSQYEITETECRPRA
jgi:hypothetical protein